MARAVVPVALGIVAFAIGAGLLWLMAAYMADNPDQTSNDVRANEWTVGDVRNLSAVVDENGPLLFRQPGTTDNEHTLDIDHSGDDPADGWRIYGAYPVDRDADCPVSQVPDERDFRDCEDRLISVTQLGPPTVDVIPRVDDSTTLVVDFAGPLANS